MEKWYTYCVNKTPRQVSNNLHITGQVTIPSSLLTDMQDCASSLWHARDLWSRQGWARTLSTVPKAQFPWARLGSQGRTGHLWKHGKKHWLWWPLVSSYWGAKSYLTVPLSSFLDINVKVPRNTETRSLMISRSSVMECGCWLHFLSSCLFIFSGVFYKI